MIHWKYALLIVAVTSRLGSVVLDYISDVADWLWYLSFGCWLIIFILAWVVLFKRRWYEFVMFSAVLLCMLIPTVDLAEASTVRLQEEAFRLYALHRIQASTPEEFLSKCIMTTYVDDDHVEHTIGECLDGFRSARWFRIIVIFDPSGQFALPGYQRSVAWRIAVDREFYGGVKIKSANSRKHLIGDFYFIKVYEDAPLAPETE